MPRLYRNIFAGEPATGYGALPLSYIYRFAAVNGGIRTRDLPINSRSNPCLHHRQSGFHFAETQHATSLMIQRSDGEADSRAEPPATRAGRTAGQARRLAVWSRATIKKQPTLETRFKQGTIDLGVMVRRSRFETTALEMPAGFGLLTIAPILRAMGGRARTYGQAM